MPSERSRSIPIPIHRTGSHTPSMLVNAKKYLSDHPQLIDCPRCKVSRLPGFYVQFHGETEVRFVTGLMSWIAFGVILLFGFTILPIFFIWVPFTVPTFKDAVHHCPSCRAWIGTYRRIGRSL